MIEAAQTALKSDAVPMLGDAATDKALGHLKACSITYQQGSAEDLSCFQANSFDVVTAGQYHVDPRQTHRSEQSEPSLSLLLIT